MNEKKKGKDKTGGIVYYFINNWCTQIDEIDIGSTIVPLEKSIKKQYI
ncbi:hypothetical protein [Treponema endosymbiont of Eucomonympha sp.]|nr:hypothetical protein [Treponema endosymbiont of Eucomonympha sp.]